MNWMWVPTLVLALLLFFTGLKLTCANQFPVFKAVILSAGLIVGIPGLVFFTYYFKLLGDPIWLCRFRAVPGSELAACGVGFLFGLLHGYFGRAKSTKRYLSAGFLPVVLVMVIMLPYLKPVLLPPHWDDYQNNWSDGVCLQSSSSSCGPASAATLLRYLGKPADERAIAREAFTSFSGTENWYLARVLRRRGVAVKYVQETSNPMTLHYPAIAGVRVDGSGHFIVVLEMAGDRCVVGDPMKGQLTLSKADLLKQYQFTGFFMVVK